MCHAAQPASGAKQIRAEANAFQHGLFENFGDFPQMWVWCFASGAADVEIRLKTIAQRPRRGKRLESGEFDLSDRSVELSLGTTCLRQNERELVAGAVLGQLPGKAECRTQVVIRGSRRQEYDVALLGDVLRKLIGEPACIGNYKIE